MAWNVFILKFLSGQIFLHWSVVTLKGQVEFQNKNIYTTFHQAPLFIIILNPKRLFQDLIFSQLVLGVLGGVRLTETKVLLVSL